MSSVQYNQNVQHLPVEGDPIAQLPADQSQPTTNELQIVNTLFAKHKPEMNAVFEEAKDALLVGALFLVFSMPQADALLIRLVPAAGKSPYILLGLKALIVTASYWLLQHFYLSRASV